MASESSNISSAPAPQRRRKKWPRRLAWVFVLLCAVIGSLVLVLQTDWALEKVRGLAERQGSAALHDGRLVIGRLDGNLLYRLSATDVRLFSGDSLVASVDTARFAYSLISLLTSEIRISRLDLVRPTVTARQRQDSTWDLLSLAPTDTAQKTTESTMLRFDRVRISGGRARAEFLSTRPDSSVSVSALAASMRDVYVGGGTFGSTLDSLTATIVAPVAPDPVEITFSGEIAEDRVICATCRLESSRSSVVANGHLLFPEASDPSGDFALRLDPLALGDVAFFLPSVDPEESVTGEASVVGTIDSLSADLSLDFSGGTAAQLQGLVRTGHAARVKVEGSVERFDPALLVRTSEFSGVVNATVDVDLTGKELAAVDGPAAVRIYDTVLNGVRLRDGHVQGNFEAGQATLDARLYLPGLRVEASGTARPFADTLAYDLRGALRAVRPARYYAAAEGIDSLDTRFEVTGRGSRLEDMVAEVSVDLQRLASNDVGLGRSRIRANLNHGDVSLDGELAVRGPENRDAGTFRLDAGGALESDVWHVERLDFQASDFNPYRIVETAPAGSLTGEGTISGDLTADSLHRVVATLSLTGSVGDVTLSSAKVEGRYEGGSGRFDLALATSMGAVEAQGDFNRRAEGFDISAEGNVSDLNLDTLAASRLATRISGSFRGRTRIRNGEASVLGLTARLRHSFVNEQEISGGLIEATLANERLSFDVDVDLPSGGLSGEGSMNPYADEIQVELSDGAFSHIDLGAWLGDETLATDLNGSMSGRVHGTDLEGAFEMDRSRFNRTEVTGGNLQLSASDSTFRLETTIDMGRGQARATVSGGFGQADTTYQGMFRLREVDVAGLMGDSLSSSVNAGCSFMGANFRLPRLEASAFCTGKKSHVGNTRIDSLRFETKLDRDSLSVTSLYLDSNIGRISGSGMIPAHSEDAGSDKKIEASIELKDIGPAAPLVGASALSGEGTLTVAVGGSIESPTLDIETALAYLKYDDYRVSSIDGFATAPDLSEGHVIASVDMGFSVYNSVPIQATSIQVEKSGDTFVLTADVRIDPERKGNISVRYDRGDSLGVLVVDALNLNLEGERWSLSDSASFEIGDQWSVRTFLLYSGEQQIALDGYIDPDGEQNLIVTLDQVRLGAFSDLVGYAGLDGTGEGYLILTGAYDDLRFESDIRIESLRTYGHEVGRFDLKATYENEQMDVDGTLSHSVGSTLTMNGFVPMHLSMSGLADLEGNEPVQLEVKSDSVPLAWIRPFIDQEVIDRVEGRLVCDVTIGGTWNEPDLSGDAHVSDGRLRLPEFKLDMRSITGVFRLEGEQLLVDNFVANSKGGTLKATGKVGFRSLSDPTFDLDGKLDRFRAISTETYHITASGQTKLTGSMIKPVFEGDVSMQDSDIYMTEELMADEADPVKLTERDLRILERRFGYQVAAGDTTTWDFYEALDLSLDVNIGRDVWIRSYSNPKMDIEFSGDLTIRKRPQQDEVLNGTINVNPSRSRVVTFARKFEITTGTIQFNGPVDDALVDIKAQYVVPSRFGGDEVKINLAIGGQVGDLSLDLSSDPQMDTGSMVSYLATGRPPGEATVGGSQAAELAVSSLSNLVEGFANSELGLDVVDIQVNPTAGTYLTVGKYVSPRVYVSLTQPLVTNDSYQVGDAAHQTEMAIEYELVSWLVAQIGSSRNHLQVNMIWEFAF